MLAIASSSILKVRKVRQSDSRSHRDDSQRPLRHSDQSRVLGELPSIVHDTSSSGQTLFVEPLAALETNNRVRTLQIEEEREVQRILEMLSREVGAHAAAIDANVEMLARIDLLAAKAELATETHASRRS